MPSLPKNLRKQLENAVKAGRRVAEGDPKKQDGAAYKALEALAVSHYEPWPSMSKQERDLRNRLRKHGRQLGDKLDPRGTQQVGHLAAEVAYEHWHRLLFARFLAENDLLIEPTSGVAVSIDEVRELAREQHVDWIDLAAGWAQRMLPQIFRSGDPVLEVALPPESRLDLEEIIESLPKEVFLADDSLGWVYQFWQADRKDEVNASGIKIGADELPAVTQLFTEDYMVDFLLDNTLGAWWAGKKLEERPELVTSALTQEELRASLSLPGVPWSYLRLVKSVEGRWTPAAGTLATWPKTAKELTCLDPCMGSGHFVVAMFTRLVALRIAEEDLDERSAIGAVIEQNLFGLEIDPRCTQIAVFNLALTAWKRVGYFHPPEMNLACSGLGIDAKPDEWIALARHEDHVREAMRKLYELFNNAPSLGSLIAPRRVGGDLFTASFERVRPLLELLLQAETRDEGHGELALTAKGIVGAFEILSKSFTLVATNVPYLGRGKQTPVLKRYCDDEHRLAKADLSTCFLERCLSFLIPGGTTAVVTPQNWWFLASYSKLRQWFLSNASVSAIATLGEEAWQTFGDRGPVTVLMIVNRSLPRDAHTMSAMDALPMRSIDEKVAALRGGEVTHLLQRAQRDAPGSRITVTSSSSGPLLGEFASYHNGIVSGDYPRFGRLFWEFPVKTEAWTFQQSAADRIAAFAGRRSLLRWDGAHGEFLTFLRERLGNNTGAWLRGLAAWGKRGVSVSGMRSLAVTTYDGTAFDNNSTVIVPHDDGDFLAIWCYCSSPEYAANVRLLNRKISVTDDSFVKVPFDADRWRKVAHDAYPHGLVGPLDDETQWVFDGDPKHASSPFQVAVARVLGYLWPRQVGSSFPDCPPLRLDGLDQHVGADGIGCLISMKGELGVADRVRGLLTAAYDTNWSSAMQNELLAREGCSGETIDHWLRDRFFAEHCELFEQRPFIWQIWDGLKDGFSALVNYHKLAAPNGGGRKTLEKLLYSYLGDWIERQRADQKRGVEGADLKLAAAEHLATELEKIIEGNPPYDIFVRWKPLHEQPIGWEPDIDDGVRINIRPFMMARPFNAKAKNACILRVTPNIKWAPKPDRGTEPTRPIAEFPWFWGWDSKSQDFRGGGTFDGKRWNDLHYTRAFKEEARARAKQQEMAHR